VRGPVPRRGPREDDPFDAVGVHAGSFIVRPALEILGGYDSNPLRISGGRSSALLVTSPELLVRSDWARHELRADLRGSYYDYPSVPEVNRPTLDARVAGRLDVTRDTRIEGEGRYLISTDRPGSPDLPADFAQLPIVTTVGGTLGIAQRFNRFELALRGSIDRITYENSKLLDGSSVSNAGRDYDQYAAQLRASYELLPGVKPFVELGAFTRVHDLPVDAFGVARDSTGFAPQAGTTFALSHQLIGEISAGYLTQTFKDPTLPDLQGLTGNAALIWAATPLTTVKLTATSIAGESTVPGVSGVLRRDAGVQVDHAFRRWLIATARLGYGNDLYVGSDRIDNRYFASLGLIYKLNRSMQVKGELREEWLRSNTAGVDYAATVALVGMRLQR
jgi:hypothetical protein